MDDLVTISGGVDVDVSFSNNGANETVKVRQIPISKLSEFLISIGDEARAIELYCDKPKGWADTLTLESANAVADKGQEINLPFLSAWWRRQAKWREIQKVWLSDDLGKADEKTPTGLASVGSAPRSHITTT